jgi:hypothetical protein
MFGSRKMEEHILTAQCCPKNFNIRARKTLFINLSSLETPEWRRFNALFE